MCCHPFSALLSALRQSPPGYLSDDNIRRIRRLWLLTRKAPQIEPATLSQGERLVYVLAMTPLCPEGMHAMAHALRYGVFPD